MTFRRLNSPPIALKRRRPVQRVPADQANPTILDPSEDKIAVELDLMQPVVAGWCFVHQGGQGRLDLVWQGSLTRTSDAAGVKPVP